MIGKIGKCFFDLKKVLYVEGPIIYNQHIVIKVFLDTNTEIKEVELYIKFESEDQISKITKNVNKEFDEFLKHWHFVLGNTQA